MRRWNRRAKLLAGSAIAALFALTVALPVWGEEPLKIGFVYVGPVGDHGWTYRHDIGRQAVEKQFGAKVKTTYVENVAEGVDAERVLRQLAEDGHKLIFATSFGYMNPVIKVAKNYPDVRFEHATGYKRADNVSTYMARFYEGRHVAGLVAAQMTSSNVIGYIGSYPIPEVVRGINAFTLALRSANPGATVKVVWVNSWYDPGRESDAARSLIDQGADVILQHTDSPAPIQTSDRRGVWAVGQASDMRQFGPKAHLTAIIDNWDSYYINRTKAVLDGTWSSEDTWKGFDAGMVEMADYNEAVPADTVTMAEKARNEIIAGTRHPFTGPIRDQDGKEVVPAGAVMSDEDLLRMDWYVEGVQGKLPK